MHPVLFITYELLGLPAARTALLLEAVVAINRLVAARQEWHFGLLAAAGAGHGMHLALPATKASARATAATAPATAAVAIAAAAISAAAATTVAVPIAIAAAASASAALFARLPARSTARRLVGEALLRVEFLLSRREDELRATVPARQRFVSVAHRSPCSFGSTSIHS